MGRPAQSLGCYIYGVVPADVEVDPETTGVGDPPARVRPVRHGKIAALVSDIDLGRRLGTPQDLFAHEHLLDATAAAEVPVLPIRFGAVLATSDAVVEEFLAPYHDEFDDALTELEGCAQYVIKGRYVEEVVLEEILRDNPEAARLREEIRDLPEDAARTLRIELGETINESVMAKREADTAALWQGVEPVSVMTAVRPPSHELDAVHLALLVETDRQDELEQLVEKIGQEWVERVKLRLLGPMAPYDFVVSQEQGAG
ncbi:GvpL/GvpF family gas vesicle protein [Acrocarpospora catenulata]|uniref:GvpL/GvpF family gas vesicle protein n=1 Tax=Acrocarpospora catenulata TaxID=2836182 RepID=UPI001BD9D56B|nr:GvpL/GvpF family gas vesicle protein [Acrocarpospora catenulata]